MPRQNVKPNLLYTVALDKPGEKHHALMAKLLASSLLRTYFTGEIVIFRSSPEPIFRLERKGVEEVFIGAEDGYTFKYRVHEQIPAEDYEWVIFLDCDILALRNIDHLLDVDDVDILYAPEPGRLVGEPAFNSYLTVGEVDSLRKPGVNSGTMAIRGWHFHEVMQAWEEVDAQPPQRPKCCFDQAAWNRVLLDTKLRKRPLERNELQFPFMAHQNYLEFREAALLHVANCRNKEIKIEFLQAMYLSRFIGDGHGYLLTITDM